MHPISFDKKNKYLLQHLSASNKEKKNRMVHDKEQKPFAGVGKDLQPWRLQASHVAHKLFTLTLSRQSLQVTEITVRTLQHRETNDSLRAFRKFW